MVNGAHDLGGMHGLGPVEREADEPVFHADWERRVFAVMLALVGQGQFTPDEFRYARELVPPAEYLGAHYFELWLEAVESLLARNGSVTADEIQERAAELASGGEVPHTEDPRLARRLHRQLVEGYSTAVEVDRPPRYRPGDEVRTRNFHPKGHTRLPRYARDKRGVVESVYPAFPVPDLLAQRRDPEPEHVYCVTFDGRELWGDSAEAGTHVRLDLWERYLHPEDRGVDPGAVDPRGEEGIRAKRG